MEYIKHQKEGAVNHIQLNRPKVLNALNEEDIQANSQETIAAIKRLYNQGWATTLSEGLALEYNDQTELSDTKDNLSAFESKKFSSK